MNPYLIILFLIFFDLSFAEMIIGRETISPGVNIVFEGAPKDIVHPENYFLNETDTDIHIEMLANWSDEAPEGSPLGGFVAYLGVSAVIESANGKINRVELTPHLNMSDNLHYAQNIKLPGNLDELYSITFTIYPALENKIGIHYDWDKMVGKYVQQSTFTYKNLDFKDIALSTRR